MMAAKQGRCFMSATESPAEILARLQLERQGPARPLTASPSCPVAITGGRGHQVTPAELQAFWFCFDRLGGDALLHGDARGVDRDVAAAARRKRPALVITTYPANWQLHGKGAGPIRNLTMVTACRFLIAFPGGRGTENAVETAQRLGRPVHLVEEELELLRLDIQRDHLTT